MKSFAFTGVIAAYSLKRVLTNLVFQISVITEICVYFAHRVGFARYAC